MRVRLWVTLFFREGGRAVARHKSRSALSMLGITIGIAAVVLIVAVGEAGSARAQQALLDLGDNLVWIEAGSRNVSGVRTGTHGTTSLTIEDAAAVKAEVPQLKSVAPQIDGGVQLIHGNRNWYTRYRGVAPEYLGIKRWRVALGQPLSQEDLDEEASKLLIGQTVREQLFGPEDPVGELVRMNGQIYEVAGVLAPKGQNADGRDQDDWVMLPHTTAQSKLRGRSRGIPYLDDILCSARAPEAVNPAIDRVIALLRERHHIAPGMEDDFNIRRPDEVVKAQLAASQALELLLISVASISLLVGGIGIMNVMLASVVQRTREIGLRLAVGARQSAVQWQFLGEAVILTLAGGVLGVLLSLAAAPLMARVLDWRLTIPTNALALAVISSVAVGVFFGFYPARLAAGLDPIEALRHE